MRVDFWENDTVKAKPTYSGRTWPHCQFVHHKPHSDWIGTEHKPPR